MIFWLSADEWGNLMEKRRVLLEDGRYLIYYTFEDDDPPPGTKPAEPARQEPQRPEEKSDE